MSFSQEVIDVSKWQGNIDFSKVKAAGIYGVIIKAGGSNGERYTDRYWEANYKGAIAAGLHVGAYFYSGKGSTSAEAGKQDAQQFLEMLKGKKFDLPVYYDVEEQAPADREGTTQAAIAFCEAMESAGYFVGIYGSEISGFIDRMERAKLTAYTLWVANYSRKPKGTYAMWQYTSNGSVDGISGRVDMNHCYEDFPSEIKSAGLNGYSKTASQPTQPAVPDYEKLADEVIAGKWSNGSERHQKLDAAYGVGTYSKVQAIVNSRLYSSKPDYEALATQVIRGDWGNGSERRKRLDAKYGKGTYSKVQAIVNKRLGIK